MRTQQKLLQVKVVEATLQVELLTQIAHTLRAYAVQLPEFVEADLFL